MFKEEEDFSKKHPVTSKIKDTDIFLHGTSLKKYLSIQSTRYLLRNVPRSERNTSLSQLGTICFAKLDKRYPELTFESMRQNCLAACQNDKSIEGVILKITGKDLKKLNGFVYADWNYGYGFIYSIEGRPIDVNYSEISSIVVTGSSSPNDPIRRPAGVHIQNPTKPLDYCQVFCNGITLETQFGLHFVKGIYIHAGGSADFILPKDLADYENAVIEVKDGKKSLKKNKLEKIPHAI